MFHVPEQHIFKFSGQRSPLKTGGLLAIIPPRCGRRSLQMQFPNGYWIGERPEFRGSADIPVNYWKDKHHRVFFCRNPYARAVSLHFCADLRAKCRNASNFSTFLEFLKSKEAGSWGWSYKRWMAGGERVGNMLWPKFDPDYIIQMEDLAGGLNAIKATADPLTDDDIYYAISGGEIRYKEYYDGDWRRHYNPETTRMVRKMFYDDFELCGYSTKLEDA